MIKTHEIDLLTSEFNQFTNNNYIILQNTNIELNDYILFKQIEIIEEKKKYTGLYQMTQVRDIITHQGLKEEFVLLVVNKIQEA